MKRSTPVRMLTVCAAAVLAALAPTVSAVPETLPEGATVTALTIEPARVQLNGTFDSAQVLVTARLSTGDTADVTRLVALKLSSKVAEARPGGQLLPLKNGTAQLTASLGRASVKAPVEVSGVVKDAAVDFIRDVNPVLSKLGCNQGTCHGAKDGKVGFKLSLRGYDPLFDVRALVDDLAGRRVNFASPDDSLMLLKSTGAVPHEGGQRTKVGDRYYNILRSWIADGAKLDLNTPRVTKIDVFPKDPVVQVVGSRQQVRVLATYADGRQRDVTAEAFIESGNMDVVSTDGGGLMMTLRRGEAPVLARYEGAYAATTVTVMGDRSGFVWQEPETWGRVDELVAAKWKRMKILPSGLAGDEEFLRRVHLDLTGLPPAADEVTAFLADKRDTRVKRAEVVERLIGSNDFVDHWANKWADLLQVNSKFLGAEGAAMFRDWIRAEVAANTPYDQFVRKVLTASGSNKETPAASYWKILRTPAEAMENTTHLFLATRFNCNKCHDHPFERWTQDQYYQLAQYFAQVDFKRDPASGDKNIGGSAVEGAKPLFEIVFDKPEGGVPHDRTGQVVAPDFPYPAKFQPGAEKPSRRGDLADWLASADNRYFAMSYVNRLWGYLMGVGLIEPLDDIRAGNPPSNPELLEHLTREFVAGGFDVQKLLRAICNSRTYQLSIAENRWNADDKINYSHATARRLPAEVLYDAVLKVTGSTPSFPGVKPGTRAAQLPDAAIDVPSGLLANLGRPPRESSCECERSNDIKLGSVMALLSGPAVSGAIHDAKNDLAKLAAEVADDRELIDRMFLRVLNRHAAEPEIAATLKMWKSIAPEHQRLTAELAAREQWWVPVLAQKERERTEAITAAETELAAYEAEIAPREKQLDDEQQAKIADADAALKKYEETLPAKFAAWESQPSLGSEWVVLDPKTYKARRPDAKLEKEKDLAIYVSGVLRKDTYTVTADTMLTNITGVKIEALSDPRLPMNGPGRSGNGNFVLTEFNVAWAPLTDAAAKAVKAAPAKKAKAKAAAAGPQKPAPLQNAVADYSQEGYNIKTAIDGSLAAADNGWAVSGQVGRDHQATFEFKEPLVSKGGVTLTFTLDHQYNDALHALGKFRLSVTGSKTPLDFGVPADVAVIVKVPAAERTDEQRKRLEQHVRSLDPELKKLENALAKAKQPRPADPKLVALKEALKKSEEPVRTDPKLVQLREDVKASEAQLRNQRLTGVQDLAWALINNPAFLFNR